MKNSIESKLFDARADTRADAPTHARQRQWGTFCTRVRLDDEAVTVAAMGRSGT